MIVSKNKFNTLILITLFLIIQSATYPDTIQRSGDDNIIGNDSFPNNSERLNQIPVIFLFQNLTLCSSETYEVRWVYRFNFEYLNLTFRDTETGTILFMVSSNDSAEISSIDSPTSFLYNISSIHGFDVKVIGILCVVEYNLNDFDRTIVKINYSPSKSERVELYFSSVLAYSIIILVSIPSIIYYIKRRKVKEEVSLSDFRESNKRLFIEYDWKDDFYFMKDKQDTPKNKRRIKNG